MKLYTIAKTQINLIELAKPLILASGSPRRQSLLESAGYRFAVEKSDADESFPGGMEPAQIAGFLARKKAETFLGVYKEGIVLAADTIVVLDGNILGKPENAQKAAEMLRRLSGRRHEVITGVAFLADGRIESFQDTAYVYFHDLESWEIDYYVSQYKPYDKAGAYGIQEWIGLIGIEKIEGSYFTVMGLPISKVHAYLKKYRV